MRGITINPILHQNISIKPPSPQMSLFLSKKPQPFTQLGLVKSAQPTHTPSCITHGILNLILQ